ncbi:MAG: 2-oxoacid:acceptor oxidoreductase family protein [Rhodospirillales bacterium]|jgi:indolepyruvate ferredoxin oxidoreductase beta subunit|nr:2-oxoacid:acceptor oxidoreductase family protein [Rhodospirillales bacterium]
MNVEHRPAVPTNVLIVGVGGQGVIMVSKVLASLCQQAGLEVKQSEVHGMAKRGGSVFSHVRFGETVLSPMIAHGEADIMVALEWAEGLRWLDYLKRDGGTFIADTQQIVPPVSFRNRRRGARSGYAPATPAEVIDLVGNGFALDATRMAAGLGNERVANTVLLGALSTALPFPREGWLGVLDGLVPPKTTEVNRRAFDAGREWVQNFDRPAEQAAAAVAVPVSGDGLDHRLEITEAWCKGCDICVKMCPERCLTLNARHIVELTDPAACTACRLCEWLCPDFAIRVLTASAPAPALAK